MIVVLDRYIGPSISITSHDLFVSPEADFMPNGTGMMVVPSLDDPRAKEAVVAVRAAYKRGMAKASAGYLNMIDDYERDRRRNGCCERRRTSWFPPRC